MLSQTLAQMKQYLVVDILFLLELIIDLHKIAVVLEDGIPLLESWLCLHQLVSKADKHQNSYKIFLENHFFH